MPTGTRTRTRGAFSLIELMVVVAILGLLAAIAVPDFIKFQCRAKQAEARPNLRALATLEEQFRAEHDRYGCINDATCPASDQLTFVPNGNTRYRYFATVTGPQSFYAEAEGVAAPLIGDLWTITEANDLEHIVGVCE